MAMRAPHHDVRAPARNKRNISNNIQTALTTAGRRCGRVRTAVASRGMSSSALPSPLDAVVASEVALAGAAAPSAVRLIDRDGDVSEFRLAAWADLPPPSPSLKQPPLPVPQQLQQQQQQRHVLQWWCGGRCYARELSELVFWHHRPAAACGLDTGGTDAGEDNDADSGADVCLSTPTGQPRAVIPLATWRAMRGDLLAHARAGHALLSHRSTPLPPRARKKKKKKKKTQHQQEKGGGALRIARPEHQRRRQQQPAAESQQQRKVRQRSNKRDRLLRRMRALTPAPAGSASLSSSAASVAAALVADTAVAVAAAPAAAEAAAAVAAAATGASYTSAAPPAPAMAIGDGTQLRPPRWTETMAELTAMGRRRRPRTLPSESAECAGGSGSIGISGGGASASTANLGDAAAAHTASRAAALSPAATSVVAGGSSARKGGATAAAAAVPAPVFTIDWTVVPQSLHMMHHARSKTGASRPPRRRDVQRFERKRRQCEAFATAIAALNLAPGTRVVDFGCGSCGLTLPLAWAFPQLNFVGVDIKRQAVDLMAERAATAGLRNVTTHCGSIASFHDTFGLALALHACGQASDEAVLQAVRCGSPYLVAPCCVGKVKFSFAWGGKQDAAQRRAAALQRSKAEGGPRQRRGGAAARKRRRRGFVNTVGLESEGLWARLAYPRSKWLQRQLAQRDVDADGSSSSNSNNDSGGGGSSSGDGGGGLGGGGGGSDGGRAEQANARRAERHRQRRAERVYAGIAAGADNAEMHRGAGSGNHDNDDGGGSGRRDDDGHDDGSGADEGDQEGHDDARATGVIDDMHASEGAARASANSRGDDAGGGGGSSSSRKSKAAVAGDRERMKAFSRACATVVCLDRNAFARESGGYETRLCTMPGLATSKSDLLVGWRPQNAVVVAAPTVVAVAAV